MRNLRNFHQSTRKSPNWDFDGILLSKAENLWASNLRDNLWWQWRMMQNWRGNWLVISKLTWGIWHILTRALENLKNLHFNELFLMDVYNVWTKKVERSYIWSWSMQNLKENWFVLSKMTWRIYQIFARSLKNSDFILEIKWWS